jgi:hypothetical protein
MPVFSIVFKAEKTFVAIVGLSVDRMSCETGKSIRGYRENDNMTTGFNTNQLFSQKSIVPSNVRLFVCMSVELSLSVIAHFC